MSEKRMLTASASPHVRSKDTVTGIMLDVIIALMPALAASVYFFGWRALAVTAVCVASCVVFEYISRKVMKRHNTLGDLSAVVTGIILAFNLPSTIPIPMAIIGSAMAIIVAKQLFGGIGCNFVNPALVGRIVLMVSFPAAMLSGWAVPRGAADAVSSATPLAGLKSGDLSALPNLLQMFLGQRGGCLGETCAAALILGGIYLVVRRVISPVIPLCYIGTVGAIMLLYALAKELPLSFVLYEMMSGGLLLGAIFMATDYTTSPANVKGKIIFSLGAGIITSVIRLWGNMNEGVSFAILLMNIIVPHIDYLTRPLPFGTVKGKKHRAKEGKAA